MAFTDEDLRRLKASAIQGHSTKFDANSILALVVRLEAAEKIAVHVARRWEDSQFYVMGTQELVEQWQRVAGK